MPYKQRCRRHSTAILYQNHLSVIITSWHAGDQVGHLWWRVLNGELPKVHQPRVFTMMIGTNDLNAADCNQNETELLAVAPGIADRRASPRKPTCELEFA